MINRAHIVLAAFRRVATIRLVSSFTGTGADGDRGLLKGATKQHWSPDLDLKDAVSLVNERGVLWNALTQDAAAKAKAPEGLLEEILERSTVCLKSRNIQGRKEVIDVLTNDLTSAVGCFDLLLGGIDVGKSLLLEALEKQLNAGGKHMVVTVSGRYDGATLKLALFRALTIFISRERMVDSRRVQQLLLRALRCGGPDVVELVAALSRLPTVMITPITPISAALPTPEERAALTFACVLDLYCALAKTLWKRERTPVIFVDAADEMLPNSPPDLARETREVLNRLTRDTKAKHVLSVVLAGSEPSELFRLRDLGFNPGHITRTVYMNEVEPASMYELLVEKWGMGPHFATACMAVYGGHIWRLANALGALRVLKEKFSASDGWTPASTANANRAVNLPRALPLLEKLAIKGQVVCNPEDPLVEKLSQQLNVAAVVQDGTFHASARPGYEDDVLLPASEHMRLILAKRVAIAKERPNIA